MCVYVCERSRVKGIGWVRKAGLMVQELLGYKSPAISPYYNLSYN